MSITDISQTVAIIVTIVAFTVTQYSNRKAVNAVSFNRMADAYDNIVKYRLQHPEVLDTASKWAKGDLNKIGKDADITKYYSYGEFCISFCDVCLYHSSSNLISKRSFNDYYLGLMDLVATENQRFFADIAEQKYCSKAFKQWFARWMGKATDTN